MMHYEIVIVLGLHLIAASASFLLPTHRLATHTGPTIKVGIRALHGEHVEVRTAEPVIV